MTKPFPRAIILGALLWLLATIAIRFFGQWLFRPTSLSVFIAFIVGGLFMAVVGPRLRLRLSRDPADADTVALGLVLPGMLADAGVALGFRHVYPNLSPVLGGSFAALMLWCYGVAALAITLHARWGGGRDARADDGGPGGDRRGDHGQGLARPA